MVREVLGVFRRVCGVFGVKRADAQLEKEIRDHIQTLTEEHVRRGLLFKDARAAARRDFGGVDQMKERYRDQRGLPFVDALVRDLRDALRELRRHPGVTATVVVMLALAIGANTAIFSLADALLLKSLPVRNPNELAALQPASFSYAAFEALKENEAFSGVFATSGLNAVKLEVGGAAAERARISLVSSSYFQVLGVSAAAGRTFENGQNQSTGSDLVAVLSYGYWQRRFGGDAAAIGRTLRLSGTPVTIIGVAPRGFFGEHVGSEADLWMPLSTWPQVIPGANLLQASGTAFLDIVARVRPGANLTRTSSELTASYRRFLSNLFGPGNDDKRLQIERTIVRLEPAATGISYIRARFLRPLQVLMAIVGLLLLIAAANVANLLLVHAETRRREIGMRLALGVSHTRLLRQLMFEGLLFGLASATAGIAVGSWSSTALLTLASPDEASIALGAGLDLRVLAFTAGVSALTCLLFGSAPAWKLLSTDVLSALSPTSRARRQGIVGLSGGLVVAQVAISLILLAGAAMFFRSLAKLWNVDPGFAPEQLLVADVNPMEAGYRDAEYASLCARMLRRLSSTAGVVRASFSENGVFTGRDSSTGRMRPVGITAGPAGTTNVRYDMIGPHYFSTLGIALRAGRDFTESDDRSATRVVVLGENLARLYFGDDDAVGRRMWWGLGAMQQELEVVGVAADVRQHSPREDPLLRFYLPYFQQPRNMESVRFLLRTTLNIDAVAGSIRQAIQLEDRRVPILSLTTVPALAARTLVQDRLVAVLSTIFAALGLALACIGLFALMAYRVARRTKDIGIRMALGATRINVLQWALGHELLLVVAGVVLGIPAAVGLAQTVSSLFFGVEPSDVTSLSVAALALVVAGLLAGAIPAMRAYRIDPAVTLRNE
jgi:predicted permease